MRSYEDAIADVAAPGQPFEVINVEREGYSLRAFKNSPSTVREFFDLARGVEGTFLAYEDEEWSFIEVMSEVDALAHALVHHFGVKKGDRVGIAMRNYPEWVISFAAILSIGAVSVSLNAWWTSEELDYAINDSGLRVLIADKERVVRASGPCERVGARILGVRLDDTTYAGVVERWSGGLRRRWRGIGGRRLRSRRRQGLGRCRFRSCRISRKQSCTKAHNFIPWIRDLAIAADAAATAGVQPAAG